jgi:tRNA (guanine-N7-)-methyltransferase
VRQSLTAPGEDAEAGFSMYANSPQVVSTQRQVHPRLHEVVRRHLRAPYRRMPSEAGRQAFASVVTRLAAQRFVLDAGCGTGASTFELARHFPDCVVVGVDKSAARLAVGLRQIEGDEAPANALLLRCDVVDFWQLAAAAQLRCTRQFLLYPNPWPKPEHLLRRWHAHPVLPAILALGGEIELRSNWRTYADEFAAALGVCGKQVTCAPLAEAQSPLTPFEAKFSASGHGLWRCRTDAG